MIDLKQQSQFFENIVISKGIDHGLTLAGNFHRYQYKLIAIVGLQWLITAFIVMVQPFLVQPPIFLCPSSTDPTIMETCSEEKSCSQEGGVIISSDSPPNIAIAFQLYCDRANFRDLTGTIFFLGGSIGTLIFSGVADKYGRKKSLFIAFGLGTFVMMFLGFAPDLFAFYILLALSWSGFDAYFASSFIILSEAGGPRLRGISNAILFVAWGVGLCVFVGIAYYVRDWRMQIIWTIAIPSVVCVMMFTQMHESPRYLFVNKRYAECGEVLAKIAKENGQKPQSESLLVDHVHIEPESPMMSQATEGADKLPETSYTKIFMNKFLRNRFILFTILFVYLYISYNGILFSVGRSSGDIYTDSLVVSFAELLAYACSIYVLDKIPRKKSFVMSLILAAIGGVFLALIPFFSCKNYFICTQGFLERVMYLIVKFAISIIFAIVFVYGAELFPTTVRSKCVSLSACIGRAIGMGAPWINTALLKMGINPILAYGVLGFVMLGILKWLPETYGKELQDDITDDMVEELEEKMTEK